MKNNNFDTKRFVDVSSERQSNAGTSMFMDSYNPGVYYTIHHNGSINRVIKTNETIITHVNNQTNTRTRNVNKYTKVNYRNPNNGSYINNMNYIDQLGRIASICNNKFKKPELNVIVTNNSTIIQKPN
tara:strand:+ start:344 stop:727 length:384 start_codon:yes stop_codon:yes gene_type:complete